MTRAVALALVCLCAAGCGYRLVRHTLPEPAGACVHFDALDGGAAYPQVALWAGSALRQEIAPDLCAPGEDGASLTGTVQAVEQASAHLMLGDVGAEKAGGRWIARASVSLEAEGRVVWGPVGVEVERDFLSTGEALTEQDAFEAHLRLLSEDLGRAVADVMYGVHPVVIEAAP
jgi:hypothetical protein